MSKRRTSRAKAQANKKAKILSAKARGDQPGESRFQKKIARKLGSGTIEPGWQWWMLRGYEQNIVTSADLRVLREELRSEVE
jgi:hypothetical protein